MLYVTVDLFRKHSNINVENDEDDYLIHLLETAQLTVENDINTTLAEMQDDNGEIPKPLKHAIILQAANLCENREILAYGKVSIRQYNYPNLIAPYIKLT